MACLLEVLIDGVRVLDFFEPLRELWKFMRQFLLRCAHEHDLLQLAVDNNVDHVIFAFARKIVRLAFFEIIFEACQKLLLQSSEHILQGRLVLVPVLRVLHLGEDFRDKRLQGVFGPSGEPNHLLVLLGVVGYGVQAIAQLRLNLRRVKQLSEHVAVDALSAVHQNWQLQLAVVLHVHPVVKRTLVL